MGTDAATMLPRSEEAHPATVRVARGPRGRWVVALSEGDARIDCATLDEAKVVGYGHAASHRPCELLICDAYHRVLWRELLDGQGQPLVERI